VADRHTRLLAIAGGASVAVAFADSSIVVLALPALYSDFHASLIGVSWVITSYNLVVVLAAFALVPFTRRLHVREVTRAGLALFTAGSIGCAAAWDLTPLIAFRCLQGFGGALLLAGGLPLLGGLLGGAQRGARVWTATGTFGAALGPALGGVLTQLADWRAIFIVQASPCWPRSTGGFTTCRWSGRPRRGGVPERRTRDSPSSSAASSGRCSCRCCS